MTEQASEYGIFLRIGVWLVFRRLACIIYTKYVEESSETCYNLNIYTVVIRNAFGI